MNLIKFFRVCYQSGPLVKTQLSGKIQILQVDLDPCQAWYTGQPHICINTKMQSTSTQQQGADVN